MKRHLYRICIMLCLLAPLFLPARAEAQTATVGVVTGDQIEQFVSGAQVRLVNSQTGLVREIPTNDEGIFWFTNVAPGPYSISVERAGFKAMHIEDLTLTVNQSFTFEAHLELGAV